jgi:hypothetical protein
MGLTLYSEVPSINGTSVPTMGLISVQEVFTILEAHVLGVICEVGFPVSSDGKLDLKSTRFT